MCRSRSTKRQPARQNRLARLVGASGSGEVRALCSERDVLMVADEIQSGLARSGRTFACDHEDVVPDIYVLGKALGGGLYPVSAIAADRDVLGVVKPGTHGFTFGGNPLAAAIGHEVVAMPRTGEFQERARELGDRMEQGLESLIGAGVLAKDTHGSTVRFAPPLVATEDDIDFLVDALREVLAS